MTRWHLQDCTRCRQPIRGEAYRLLLSAYRPMPEGPDWECVGDWLPPQELAGTLCGGCATALEDFAMGYDRQEQG